MNLIFNKFVGCCDYHRNQSIHVEREREREGERGRESVCVCVCVWEREQTCITKVLHNDTKHYDI